MVNDSYEEVGKAHYGSTMRPVVSVAMIAYNVGKYLPAAIESVLTQKTNFKVELVIGEDCSPDNTREIALDYQQKYPHVIKVLLPEKNQGLTPNSVATQNACSGKYIALLDSDDYWTDETKLQRQVSFLEENPSFSGSAHQADIIFDDVVGQDRKFGEEIDNEYGVFDTIQHRKFHTSALVYKKEYWDKVGGIPPSISSNERAIYPMIAIFGMIKYFKDSMCVYRRSSVGLSERLSYKDLVTDLAMIPWLKKIDSGFPLLRFKSFLHLCIYSYPKKVPFFPLLSNYLSFAFLTFSYFPKNLGDLYYGTLEFLRKFKNG